MPMAQHILYGYRVWYKASYADEWLSPARFGGSTYAIVTTLSHAIYLVCVFPSPSGLSLRCGLHDF